MMNKEEEQEFWEQCGFTYQETTPQWALKLGKPSSYWWLDPHYSTCRGNKLPPIDLNNLLEYAVSEARKRFGNHAVYELLVDWAAKVANNEDPTGSLFELIFKAFGGKG